MSLSLLVSKVCSLCGEEKPIDEFYRRNDWGDGYRNDCKVCVKDRVKARYKAQPEKMRDYEKNRRVRHPKTPEQRERARIASKEWWDANGEAYRQREGLRNYQTEYQRQRRAKVRESLTIPFTPEQLDQRMSMWGYKCWICGGPYTEVDHVKPIAKGGAHILANLRPICRSCNASKNDKWPLSEILA